MVIFFMQSHHLFTLKLLNQYCNVKIQMFYTIIILLNTFILYNTRKLEALNPFFLSSGLSLTIWHNSKNMVLPINCIAWVTFWNQSPQLNQLNGQMFDAQMVTIPEILTEQSVTKI